MILNLEAEEDPPANNGRDREKSKQPFSGYIVRDRGRTLCLSYQSVTLLLAQLFQKYLKQITLVVDRWVYRFHGRS